jgi:hypothetical protein
LILIDANVFMYAGGSDHPHKQPSLALLRRVARGELEAAVDAEVLQEILHRYRAIGRWEDGCRVFDLARRIVPAVIPVTAEVVDRTREILDAHAATSARDALHAAVYRTVGAAAICSYDRDFDQIAGIRRIDPGDSAGDRNGTREEE